MAVRVLRGGGFLKQSACRTQLRYDFRPLTGQTEFGFVSQGAIESETECGDPIDKKAGAGPGAMASEGPLADQHRAGRRENRRAKQSR